MISSEPRTLPVSDLVSVLTAKIARGSGVEDVEGNSIAIKHLRSGHVNTDQKLSKLDQGKIKA